MAIDPFHDVDLDLVGVPDETPGRSVLFNVTRNLTISAPTSAGTGRFDTHISFTPMDTSATMECFECDGPTANPFDSVDLDLVANPNSAQRIGGCLQICTVPTGARTFNGVVGEEYSQLTFNDVVPTDGSALVRVAAAAFEVYNVTEELNKSGSVTVYRCDVNKDEVDPYLIYDGTHALGRKRTQITSGPPSTEQTAKQLNGITWEAADGCLVPIIMEAHNQPQKYLPKYSGLSVEAVNERRRLWMEADTRANDIFFDTATGLAVVGASVKSPTLEIPAMCSGAYFTGLSNETSLTITARFIVEVFPLPMSAFVPLAGPANPYDATAIQCYGEIMHKLHAGYPVHDNASGDFFRKAMSALRMVGNKVLDTAALVSPRAAAVSAGLKAASDIAKDVKKSKKKKKQSS